jgi:GT2 family glycosyltransferase
LFDLLDCLLAQPHLLQQVFIIDNLSSDGTGQALQQAYLPSNQITYVNLNENLGGAGGFTAGIKCAYGQGYDWFWLMDDDALPASDALENLIKQAVDPFAIYGSTALHDGQLCWPITYQGQVTTELNELSELTSVGGIPFLGFLIHREMVNKIGFPDQNFFISGDDIEYCQRAKRLGYPIVMVKGSHIYHPMPPRISINLFSKPFSLLLQEPWRRYYDIRNRVVIARRHYGLKLYTATLPGILLRWLLTLFLQENRWLQSVAYFKGIKDGLRNRLGKTWEL